MSAATPSACRPNEASVVQPRRLRSLPEEATKLWANMMSSSSVWLLLKDTRWSGLAALGKRKKGRALARPSGTYYRSAVSLLRFRRRSGRLGGCARGPGRASRSRRSGSGRSHAGLRVVSFHDSLGDIHGVAEWNHWTLRPGRRRVQKDAVAVIGRIFLDDGRHLLQDALGNFILLRLRLFTGVLHIAVQRLLLGLDLLHQVIARIVVQLVALSIELFLERFDLIVLALQLSLLGFQLLAEGFEVAAAFIGGEDRLLDVDGSDLCAGRRDGRG